MGKYACFAVQTMSYRHEVPDLSIVQRNNSLFEFPTVGNAERSEQDMADLRVAMHELRPDSPTANHTELVPSSHPLGNFTVPLPTEKFEIVTPPGVINRFAGTVFEISIPPRGVMCVSGAGDKSDGEETVGNQLGGQSHPSWSLHSPLYMKYLYRDTTRNVLVPIMADARDEYMNYPDPRMTTEHAVRFLAMLYAWAIPLMMAFNTWIGPGGLREGMDDYVWGEHVTVHNTIILRLRWPPSKRFAGQFMGISIIRLVMIHELAHIRVSGHSGNFMDLYLRMYDYAVYNGMLNPNGETPEEGEIMHKLHYQFNRHP